jgi:low temperature requirement protein LtrA
LPWIASPVSQAEDGFHFYRHSDATPMELFFDLFFVANLSTFTATHQINNFHGKPRSSVLAQEPC